MTPLPRHADVPAMIVELNRDGSAAGAIEKIRERRYPEALNTQLSRFSAALNKYATKANPGPKNWFDAFDRLAALIEDSPVQGKKTRVRAFLECMGFRS
jgi:hypothetical protein